MKWLWKWIKSLWPWGGNDDTPTPAPTDDLGTDGVEWTISGFSGTGAVRDVKVKVTAAALDMGALRWTLAGITGNWPVSDSTYGIDCLWIKKGGRWLGGKFDWERGDGNQVRPTSAHVQGGGGGFYKEWASIGGYAAGDEWRAAVYSKDGARRSNVVGGVVK